MKLIFIRGLARVLPITITLYILISLFIKIDQLLQPLILEYLNIDIPGLGFMIIIILIFLMGIFKGKFFSKQFNKFINKVPVAKSIYGGTKEVVDVVFDENDIAFSKVVEVDFPSKDIRSIGFITNETDICTTIMIPTTPNPSNGFMMRVYDKSKYDVLDMDVKEGFKLVVKMGTQKKVLK